jgi:uncharacterized membrane protein
MFAVRYRQNTVREGEHVDGTTHRAAGHLGPAHPAFTHFPLAAYVFAAAFDIVSAAAGARHRWAGQLWHAGTFVLIGGLVICLATMATGFLDLVRFWPRPADSAPAGSLAGPAATPARAIAVHVSVMAAAFMIGSADVAWRLSDYGPRAVTPPGVVALSLTAAIVACTGGFIGGRLVFRYGLGVAADALAAGEHRSGADTRGTGTLM